MQVAHPSAEDIVDSQVEWQCLRQFETDDRSGVERIGPIAAQAKDYRYGFNFFEHRGSDLIRRLRGCSLDGFKRAG